MTSQKQGYKGSVTVYSADLEEQPVMVFDSSDRFVTDAYVTDDCKRLAAVTLGQENGVFVSNIVLYSLEKAGEVEPIGDYDVSDGLVLAIGQQGDRLVTVADTCLSLADRNGEDQVRYDYSGGYLREYALEGGGFTALLLNRYRSGSVGRLVTVDDQGEEIASLEVRTRSGCFRRRPVSGRAVSGPLVIYNQEPPGVRRPQRHQLRQDGADAPGRDRIAGGLPEGGTVPALTGNSQNVYTAKGRQA